MGVRNRQTDSEVYTGMQRPDRARADLENDEAARLAVTAARLRRCCAGTKTDKPVGKTERRHAEDSRARCFSKNYTVFKFTFTAFYWNLNPTTVVPLTLA